MTTTLQPATSLRPWQIDESHTNAQFSVRHLMISTVRGRFAETKGTVAYDPAKADAVDVRVEIPVASITTHSEQRDAHLKSPDFFDAATYPTIQFIGKRIEGDTNGRFKLIGELTIRGTTKPITLDVVNEGTGNDPWGNERMGFSATAKLNRLDFGLHWNAALETGGVVVGEEVKLSIDVEIMRPTA
ncbi:MAG: YceI family protein [Gemmatimonadaceae bacterium]